MKRLLEGRADASAFDLTPSTPNAGNAAVLCLHGFTGTPYEVRPLAEAFVARGLRARGPWMAGHERGPEVLARTPFTDWIALAERELASLRREHARVYLAGVSMGGLVCLRLAEIEPVDGLVVVGVPLALPRSTVWLARALRALMPFRAKHESDIRDPAARARHPGLAATPLAGVAELVRLQGLVVPELDRIEAPILVSHGRLDRTARPEDATRLHAAVRSRAKSLLYLERSGHVATVDYDGDTLARTAADFLAKWG